MVQNAVGQHTETLRDNNIKSELTHLSSQQLMDTANHYYRQKKYDVALTCYSLVIGSIQGNTNVEQQKRIIEALCKSAVIYCLISDYSRAYDLFIRALHLNEHIGDVQYQVGTLSNIGNIYFHINNYEQAKLYYAQALHLNQDSLLSVLLLNNLGEAEIKFGHLDSAFNLLSQAMQISKRHDNAFLCNILNNFAIIYKNKQLYDSAYYCYRLSLDEARKTSRTHSEADFLSDLGNFFLELGKIDSALFYIGLSNDIAIKNNFLDPLSKNYLNLSKIEKLKGHHQKALDYFEKHTRLNDSISGTAVVTSINQAQHALDIAKQNERIDQFIIDRQIKKQTILFQNIGIGVLLLICGILLVVYFQKRQLETAYKVLFEKNIEIMNLQDNSLEERSEKRKNTLTDETQNELLPRILALMEDTTIICDTEFSIEKLAELTQSNQKYISQVINNALQKNFRSFLNSYRIREAQRLFLEPEASKYTIETIAFKVGFKSRNTFTNAFKEITGVNPNFYLKSVLK